MDLTLRLVCPMALHCTLKYNLPSSLYCELARHMLDREICIGKATVSEGLYSTHQMNVEGYKDSYSFLERKRKETDKEYM